MNFSVIIPARYNSSRLPAKLLRNVHGKPLLQHTYENALSSNASAVIIATDDTRIEAMAKNFGASVCMTNVEHQSGTSRIAEVLQILDFEDDEIIVNLQGDEPMLNAKVINQVVHNFIASNMQMATLCEQIEDKSQYLDPNCVKVVFDKFGKALYFSRAPIPFFRENGFDKNLCFKHIGIYASQSGFIKQYLTMGGSNYEQAERLEQLTVLSQGFDIHVAPACMPTGFGVDTENDLAQVIEALK